MKFGIKKYVLAASLFLTTFSFQSFAQSGDLAPDISMLKSGDYSAPHDLTMSGVYNGQLNQQPDTCYRNIDVDVKDALIIVQIQGLNCGVELPFRVGITTGFVQTFQCKPATSYPKDFDIGTNVICGPSYASFGDSTEGRAEYLYPLSDGNFLIASYITAVIGTGSYLSPVDGPFVSEFKPR